MNNNILFLFVIILLTAFLWGWPPTQILDLKECKEEISMMQSQLESKGEQLWSTVKLHK